MTLLTPKASSISKADEKSTDTKFIPFKWDGSNLGDVDAQIQSWEIRDEFTIVYFKSGESAYANRFDSSVPLIADELKPLFGLSKIGRHRCLISGRSALISQIVANERRFTPLIATDDMIPSIRRAYVFRWSLGLTQNFDKMLWVRSYKSGITLVTSFCEKKYDFASAAASQTGSVKPTRSRITETAVKKWFGDWKIADDIMREIFGHRNMTEIRFEIDAIVRRVDKSYVSWVTGIISRIQVRL